MGTQSLATIIDAHATLIVSGLTIFLIVVLAWMIKLQLNLSELKQNYYRMMQGTDGVNLEKTILKQLDATDRLFEKDKQLDSELRRQNDILERSITRVGVVRYSAFEDIGSDLSYAVALLDSHGDGVVMSSLFGRDESRTYAKPVKGGTSEYPLTDEEQQALKKTMDK